MHSASFKRPRIAAFVLFLALIAVIWSSPHDVFATSDDFETEIFNVSATVSENHVIHVKETIRVNFNQSAHHGITRYIPVPEKYYKIRNIDSGKDPSDYEMESGSDSSLGGQYSFCYIKIGDPDEVITGKHTYTLSYDLVCYEDDSEKEDYLSLDLLPTEWVTAIGKTKLTLTMPKAIDWDKVSYYSGAYRTVGGLDPMFSKTVDRKTNTLTIQGSNLPRHYGVTVKATLPQGYWVDPASRHIFRILLYCVLVLIPLLLLLLWFLFGRDPKVVRTVEFYPPENMTPAELGYIIDGNVEGTDISSLLMYYASKGYLKIREYERNAFRVTKLRKIDNQEKSFAKYLFNQMFAAGDEVDMQNPPAGFGDALMVTKDKLIGHYNKKKNRLFTEASKVCRGIGMALLVIPPLAAIQLPRMETGAGTSILWIAIELIIQIVGIGSIMSAFDHKDARTRTSNIVRFSVGIALTGAGAMLAASLAFDRLGSMPVAAAVLVSIAISYVFVALMKARTKKSAEWQGKILGFRDFIRDAEYDRLKTLSDQDPEYFFDIMPYAYVMGMSTRWAKKFTDIKVPQPEWYDSYDTASVWTPLWYGSMLNSWGRGIAGEFDSAVADAVSEGWGDIGGDGGGGFGGGGFSGGGFGGGGGGAW